MNDLRPASSMRAAFPVGERFSQPLPIPFRKVGSAVGLLATLIGIATSIIGFIVFTFQTLLLLLFGLPLPT